VPGDRTTFSTRPLSKVQRFQEHVFRRVSNPRRTSAPPCVLTADFPFFPRGGRSATGGRPRRRSSAGRPCTRWNEEKLFTRRSNHACSKSSVAARFANQPPDETATPENHAFSQVSRSPPLRHPRILRGPCRERDGARSRRPSRALHRSFRRTSSENGVPPNIGSLGSGRGGVAHRHVPLPGPQSAGSPACFLCAFRSAGEGRPPRMFLLRSLRVRGAWDGTAWPEGQLKKQKHFFTRPAVKHERPAYNRHRWVSAPEGVKARTDDREHRANGLASEKIVSGPPSRNRTVPFGLLSRPPAQNALTIRRGLSNRELRLAARRRWVGPRQRRHAETLPAPLAGPADLVAVGPTGARAPSPKRFSNLPRPPRVKKMQPGHRFEPDPHDFRATSLSFARPFKSSPPGRHARKLHTQRPDFREHLLV